MTFPETGYQLIWTFQTDINMDIWILSSLKNSFSVTDSTAITVPSAGERTTLLSGRKWRRDFLKNRQLKKIKIREADKTVIFRILEVDGKKMKIHRFNIERTVSMTNRIFTPSLWIISMF